MRKTLLFIATLLSAIAATAVAPEERVRLADPFILLHEDTYYAYGTHSRNGIEFYTSNDLKTWRRGGLALHKRDSYGEKWFWAPEVYLLNGKFYMYYTADEHICVATADSPAGPFKQVQQVPMITNKHTIDNTIFIDDDGKAYMFYVLIRNGFKVCVAELEDDLMTIKPNSESVCIKPEQPWERVGGKVNEGPSIIKRNGTYYMLYSGNGYKSQEYGIGYASAKNIRGPWRKTPHNPILQHPGELVGTGHGAAFYDKRGRLHYVFHAHHSHEKIHPRYMCITRASFKRARKGTEHPYISEKYFTPKVVRE